MKKVTLTKDYYIYFDQKPIYLQFGQLWNGQEIWTFYLKLIASKDWYAGGS